MMLSLYISAAAYLAGLGAGLAGQPLASSALMAASVLAAARVLLEMYVAVEEARRALWSSARALWIGAEYRAGIALFALGGALYSLAGALLALALPRQATVPDLGELLALGMLALGTLASGLTALFSLAYLVEVFTRDIYLLQLAAGRTEDKPHSATFYLLISFMSLGILFFYWLHLAWRRAQALKSYIVTPAGLHGAGDQGGGQGAGQG